MTVETFTETKTVIASSTTNIHPNIKSIYASFPAKVPLSGLDCFHYPSEVLIHWLFRSPPAATNAVIDKLKATLAEALEFYPLLTGTVCGHKSGDLYIAMDEQSRSGIPFIFEKRITPYDGDSDTMQPRKFTHLLGPGSITFIVKVVQYSCGTIGIASSLHHQVADLAGYLDFHEVWAQLARGEDVDPNTVPVHWFRKPERFFPRPHNKPLSSYGYTVNPTTKPGSPADRFWHSSVSTKWEFTKGSLEKLKSDLSPPSDGEWISTGDAIVSLAFGALTRARELNDISRGPERSRIESQTENLLSLADTRFRATQGKVERNQYFGNLNIACISTVSRIDLLSPTVKAAGRVALCIRKQLDAKLSPEAIANELLFYENHKILKHSGRILSTADMLFSNWCRFDLYGVKFDFGMGKPFQVKCGMDGRSAPGLAFAMQNNEAGDVIAWIGVESGAAEDLRSDPLLNEYATLIKDK